MANCILLPHRDLWPVGFRFHPTDDELINHYLKNKMLGNESLVEYIRQVDICKYDPCELPSLSNGDPGEQEWFFFSAQGFKYSNGRRSNRATGTGYWKSTGKDRKIMARGTKTLIGTKKTLVFHRGRVPNGIRTNWVIHEYHLHSDSNVAHPRSFVICRLKRKSDENDVFTCNEAESKGLVNSTFENLRGMADKVQENVGNGQSLFQPDLQVLDYDILDLQSPFFSDHEPTSMDFQATNSYGTHVNGPSDEDIDTEEFVNSILVDDETCFHEGTPNCSINDFNYEELLHLVSQNQRGGFNGDTGMNAASDWQYDHASRSLFGEHTQVQTQSFPMIKKSRRRPLTSKIIKYGGENDLPSPRPREDGLRINCIFSYHSDDSDKEIRTLGPQGPKFHKVADHVDTSQIVQLERETQLRVVSSHDKAKAVPKRIKVVKPAKTPNKDSIEDQKSEVENSVANLSKSGHGSLGSRVKCSSSILTTKCVQHKSSPASAYVARACIGFILFIMVARQVLVYGNW